MSVQEKPRWTIKRIYNWPAQHILRYEGFVATVAPSVDTAKGWYVDIMAESTETARSYYIFFKTYPGATVHQVKREAIRRIKDRDFNSVSTNGLQIGGAYVDEFATAYLEEEI